MLSDTTDGLKLTDEATIKLVDNLLIGLALCWGARDTEVRETLGDRLPRATTGRI